MNPGIGVNIDDESGLIADNLIASISARMLGQVRAPHSKQFSLQTKEN